MKQSNKPFQWRGVMAIGVIIILAVFVVAPVSQPVACAGTNASTPATAPAASQPGPWKSLFNGKDLTGWDTYLKVNNNAADGPYGLNNDPRHVVSVLDGMLRLSGEIFGGAVSKDEYENYHFRCEFKWGEKVWSNQANVQRNSGILYHSFGPADAASSAWMKSAQLQVKEREFGDYLPMSNVTAQFTAAQTTTEARYPWQYNFDSYRHSLVKKNESVMASGNYEKPHGEWNKLEIVARGGDIVYIVNGYVVNRLYALTDDDTKKPMTRGKIQLQSENAEAFFRNIEMREIPAKASAPGKLAASSVRWMRVPMEGLYCEEVMFTNVGDQIVQVIAKEIVGQDRDQFSPAGWGLSNANFVLKPGDYIEALVGLKDPATKAVAHVRLESIDGPIPGGDAELKRKPDLSQ